MRWEGISAKERWRRVAFVWATFAPLVSFNTFEVLIRIAAQGGPLSRWSSWTAYYRVIFHQIEALFMLCLAYRFSRSTYLLVVAWRGLVFDLTDYSSDRITVPILVFYRVLRAYGIYFKITVQNSRALFKHRRAIKHVWMKDHRDMLTDEHRRILVRLQKVANTVLFQVAMAIGVVLHCGLYSATRTFGSLNQYYWMTKFTGYSLCFVFSVEFLVRAGAQGGFEQFFAPCLHRVEAAFAALGVFFVGYASWYHMAVTESRTLIEPSGVATASILLVHRLIRLLGIRLRVSASMFDADSIMEAQAMKRFRSKFDDILRIPEVNLMVKVKPREFVLRVHKAELRPEAFKALHLPVTLRGGLVEELNVVVKTSRKQMTVVSVSNLLVIVGPGDGLAEAGGIESIGKYWNHENVRVAKARLVELIHARLSPPQQQASSTPSTPVPGGDRLSASSSNSRGSQHSRETLNTNWRNVARRFLAHTKNRAAALVKETCLRHVEFCVRNLTLQYDDMEGRLGCGPVTMTMRVGNVRIDREQDMYLQCMMLRAAVNVDCHGHIPKPGVPRSPKSVPPAARTTRRLLELLEEHPRLAVEELERLNRISIWRTWAFEELERTQPALDRKRHRRMERLPEQRSVLALTRLVLSADPENCPERPKASADDASELDRALRRADSAASGFSGASAADGNSVNAQVTQQPWKWCVDATPMRIAFDDGQARCAKTLARSIQSWCIHDNAFKWWPFLNLADLEGQDRSKDGGRSALVRLWWVYAIHRVLAVLNKRPRVFWMDVMWRAQNYQRYKALTQQIAGRSVTQVPLPLSEFAQGWETLQMEELQVSLPLADIIDCRKQALAIMVRRRPSLPEDHGFLARSGDSHSAVTLHVVDEEEPSFRSPATAQSRASSSEVQASAASAQAQPSQDLTAYLAGAWEVCMPALEVRILRRAPSPEPGLRPMLLLGRVSGIVGDATIDIVPPEVPGEEAGATCGVCLTVDSFHVRCPEATPLALGGTGHLLSILQPLLLGLPERPELPAGRRAGQEVAFALRARLASSCSGSCEVRVPDLRVLMYEPLLMVLLSYVRSDEAVQGRSARQLREGEQGGGQAGARAAAGRWPLAGGAADTLDGLRLELENSMQLNVLSGRVGPLQNTFQVSVADRTAMSSYRADLHDRAQRVRDIRKLMRQLHAQQSTFEMLAGLAGLHKDVDVHLHVGAIHCMHVGEYSDRSVLVEQCCFWPFTSRVWRGSVDAPSDDSPEGAMSQRQFVADFNGFESDPVLPGDSLPRWGVDSEWLTNSTSAPETLSQWRTTWRRHWISRSDIPRVASTETNESEFSVPSESMWQSVSRFFCSSEAPGVPRGACMPKDAPPGSSPRSPASSRGALSGRSPSGASGDAPPAAFEFSVFVLPFRDLNGEWLLRQSRRWHTELRSEAACGVTRV